MRRFLRPLVFLVAIAGGVPCDPAFATVGAANTFTAVAVDQAPPIALDFTVDPWPQSSAVTGLENLTTRTPATKFPTVAHVVFGKDAMYVAIEAEQTGAPITATQTTNDVGFGLDDFVGIGIDPTGNGETYYFMATPLGVRYQQSVESVRYNPQWTAYAKVTNGSYRALLVIPFNVLRTQRSPVQRWRFNIIRHIAASSENETWAYDPLMNDGGGNGGFPTFGDSRYWPYLDGVHVTGGKIRPKPRAELYGLESFGRDRGSYEQALGNFAPEGTRNVGLDVNVPLTSTIAFVGALAPDFSNVEVDQQTIAPQEFRRDLTEYRPFFSQGATYFNPVSQIAINESPNQLFYSPGIGPFDRGAKIEGTYGLQSIGLLNVQGAGFNDSVFGFKHALPDRTFSYSVDVADAHHADGNDTAYPAADNDLAYDGEVAGRNVHTGFVYAFDYGAEHGDVPGTTPRLAYKSEDLIDVHKQNYEVNLRYEDVGPYWNPIDGFTSLADIRGPSAFFDFSGNPSPKTPFKRLEFFIYGDRFLERSGAPHQSDFNANVDVILRDQLHFSGGPAFSALRLYDDGLSTNGYPIGYVGGVTVPFNQHSFNVGYKDGTSTPYDFSTSWGPFTTFNPDGTMRPTYLRSYSATTSRPIGTKNTIGLEYDGTLEAFPSTDPVNRPHDGQNLTRVTFGQSFGDESNLAISLRDVAGTGGFAAPGLNLAASYHRRFANDSELFVNYGTPAATATLQRVIVKYVLRVGSAAGT